MFWVAQPVLTSELGDSASVTVQLRPTSLRYQFWLPSGVVGVSVCSITGGVVSVAAGVVTVTGTIAPVRS